MIYKSEKSWVRVRIFSEREDAATIDDRVHVNVLLVVVAAVAEVADKPTRVFKRPFCLFLSPLHHHHHLVNPSVLLLLCGSLLFYSPSVFLSDVYVSLSLVTISNSLNPKQQTTQHGRRKV